MSSRDGIVRHNDYAGPRLDPFDTVHSREPIDAHTPGIESVIATYASKLKILLVRNGQPAGGWIFRGDELVVIEKAVRKARSDRRPTNVGMVPVPSGASIEVSGGGGRVILRWILPNGHKGRARMIVGTELVGLRRALNALGMDLEQKRSDRRDDQDRRRGDPTALNYDRPGAGQSNRK